jgi:hypothetical protein
VRNNWLSKWGKHDIDQSGTRGFLFEKVGLNKREAKDIVEEFFLEIRVQLELCASVKLSGHCSLIILTSRWAINRGKNEIGH